MNNNDHLFKLELDMAYPHICIYTKYFNSLKTLNQWLKRNSSGLIHAGYRKYILTDTGYELFIIEGNTILTISELEKHISMLKKEEKDRIDFVEYLKNKSLQNNKNEE